MKLNQGKIVFVLIAIIIAVLFFGLTDDFKKRSDSVSKKEHSLLLKIGNTIWYLSQPRGAFSGTRSAIVPQKQDKLKTKTIAIDNKKKGSLYFKPPKEMTEYITEIVPIALSRSKIDFNLLPKDFFDNLKPPERRDLDVSGLMAVDLVGNPDEFKSELLGATPKTQQLSGDNIGVWRWAVTPLKPGNDRILKLTVYSVIPIFGQDRFQYIETYQEKILVRVNYPGRVLRFLSNNLQTILASILSFVFGVLFILIKQKIQSKKAPAE